MFGNGFDVFVISHFHCFAARAVFSLHCLLPPSAKESLLPTQWRVKFRHVSAGLQGRRACLTGALQKDACPASYDT